MLKVFFKTFVICVLICVVWTIWSFFQNDSFRNEMQVKTEVYSKQNDEPKEEIKQDEQQEIIEENNTKLYFLNEKNQIVETKRQIENTDLEKTIKALLKGTTKEEKRKGIYSEIPSDSRLLSISTYPDKIIINLNSKFITGGGTTTIINRIKQLKKTVDAQSGKKPIYLQVEGKQVEYIGGDGVYLEQPLNEDVL